MVSKRKAFDECIELLKEYAALSHNDYDLDEDDFYRNNGTKAILHRIEQVKRNIASIRHENAVSDWLKTDEGDKWNKEKNDKLVSAKAKIASLLTNLKNEVCPIILNVLGEGWEVEVYTTRLDIMMVDKEEGKTEPTPIFGHSFELLWHNNPWTDSPDFGKKFNLSANYGCLGDFDVNEDTSIIKLLSGMSKLLGDKEVMSKLTDIIGRYYVNNELASNERSEAEHELRNPPVPLT